METGRLEIENSPARVWSWKECAGGWLKHSAKVTTTIDTWFREERPVSMNLSEPRSVRSKSENSPRQIEIRVPMKVQRSPEEDLRRTRQNSENAALYKSMLWKFSTRWRLFSRKILEFSANITVDDAAAVLRPKKEPIETNNNRYSYSSRWEVILVDTGFPGITPSGKILH